MNATVVTALIPHAEAPASAYLDTARAAKLIGMSASWLEHDRQNTTPVIPFCRFGSRAVRYRVADLLAFGQRVAA